MLVVDYYGPHDAAYYQCLAASGVVGIARYLTATPDDPRAIAPAEVAAAHNAGLEIHFVYEMNPTYAGYFTFAQGAEDCRQAMARLADLGAPPSTVVYFAVDVNIEPSITDAYFNGVESSASPSITAGAYGYQRLCEYAKANFPNIGKHLWQTYGTPTVTLDLYQHLQQMMCGAQVDVNDCNVTGWKGDTMTDDDFKAQFARVIGPGLEDEIQQRKQEAIAEAQSDAFIKKVATVLGDMLLAEASK